MESIRKPEVKAIVSVDRELVPFISLKLHQEMSAHHYFELLLDHRSFDPDFFKDPEKRLKLVNSKVIIDLQHGDDAGKAYVFSGIVTRVNLVARDGLHGLLLLEGASNTIELERGLRSQSYSKTDLNTILREVTSGCPNLTCEIMPAWKADIDFSLQFMESDWTYLSRICKAMNERYYYTGLDLYVGPHPEFPVVNLVYDEELMTFEMCSQLRANQFSEYYYQRETHSTLRQDSPTDINGAGSTLQQIGKKMDRLTTYRKSNHPVAGYVPDMGSLIEQSERRKVSTAAEMMYVRGKAKTCDIRIGRLLSIRLAKTAGGTDMGTYRVYKVVHELDENGRFFCEFEAIPADLEYLPTPEVPVPTPNPIECEVIRNEDPLGMGRVQVFWPFDERPCSAWIPLMTPSGGGNGQGLGPVNRGITMIPEISDSVLVSFLDRDLFHPVVIGSMIHANNSENRGSVNNNIKTIITRSRHMIQFDDKNGNESITIIDKNKNTIFIDTANDNITITAHNNLTLNATETMTLNARDVYINARDNISSTAGKNIQDSAGNNIIQSAYGDIVESSDNRQEVVEEEYSRNAKKSDHFAGEINLISTKEDILVQSVKKVTWNSGEKTNMF